MLFLAIISWKGVSCFNEGLFLSGGHPIGGRGALVLVVGVFEKNLYDGEGAPLPLTMGNPVNFAGNEFHRFFYKDYHHN